MGRARGDRAEDGEGIAAPPPMGRARGDRGQAVVLAGVLVAILAVIGTLVVARLGGAAHQRARAHSAADAAALAGAQAGRGSAEVVAEANGARLDSYVEEGGEVEVRVRVEGSEATARARLGPG